jgi:hypothetical protein
MSNFFSDHSTLSVTVLIFNAIIRLNASQFLRSPNKTVYEVGSNSHYFFETTADVKING